jgi:hypothetical protein
LARLAIWDFVADSGGELMEHVAEDEYLAEPVASE